MSNHAEAAREAARKRDGKFGEQEHAEPSLSLAAPKTRKVTSKGTEYTVTLPDGTVATRTSKKGNYTHVVVASPQFPEAVVAEAERVIERNTKDIEAIDRALAEPSFKRRQRFNDRDPDIGYSGTPVYYGFDAWLSGPDGKSVASTTCNSHGVTSGVYDEKGEYEYRLGDVEGSLIGQATMKRLQSEEQIDAARKRIAAVNDGTYDFGPYGVVRWSSRADLAEKAASGEFAANIRTRSYTVMPIDD